MASLPSVREPRPLTNSSRVAPIGRRIESGRLVGGKLGAAQRKLVQEWIEMYKDELRAAWQAVRNDETPERIPGPDADNDN